MPFDRPSMRHPSIPAHPEPKSPRPGTRCDATDLIGRADCVVLPSYREGTPKTLLEAAAMGKPIVTTDVPGCRETVVDQYNGLLCQVRDGTDLADKMLQVLRLSDQALHVMGKASRQLAETKFDERIVLDKYLRVVAEATQAKRPVASK